MNTLAARLARPFRPSCTTAWLSGVAPSTRIATLQGEVQAIDLRIGHTVLTRDSGPQEIVALNHELRGGSAVLIRAGALGRGLPERDVTVAASHRVLFSSEVTRLLFNADEVFAAAGDLVGRHGIEWAEAPAAGLVSISLTTHECVLTDGAWTETEPLRLAGDIPVTARRVLRRFEAQLLS